LFVKNISYLSVHGMNSTNLPFDPFHSSICRCAGCTDTLFLLGCSN